MRYRTHMLGGAAAGLCVAIIMEKSLPAALAAAAVSAATAKLPDIDHKDSHISNQIKPVGLIVNTVFGQRKLFHSLVLYLSLYIVAILTVPQFLISIQESVAGDTIQAVITFIGQCIPVASSQSIIFFGLVGVVSHLLLDTLTPDGVPFFYPIIKKKLSIANIKNGSVGEMIVMITCFCLCLVQILYLLRAAV